MKGGIGGGFAGLAFGALGVYAAGARYPAFRQLTLPLRAFLITSAGTFSGEMPSTSLGEFNEDRGGVLGRVECPHKAILRSSGRQARLVWMGICKN